MGGVGQGEAGDDFEVGEPVVEGQEGGVALNGGVLGFAFFFFLSGFEGFGLIDQGEGGLQGFGGDFVAGELGLGGGVGEEGGVEVAGLFVPEGIDLGFTLVEAQVGLALGVVFEGDFGQFAVGGVGFVGLLAGGFEGLGSAVLFAIFFDLGVVEAAGGGEEGLAFLEGGGVVAEGVQGDGDFGLLLGVGDDGGCVGEEFGQAGIYYGHGLRSPFFVFLNDDFYAFPGRKSVDD